MLDIEEYEPLKLWMEHDDDHIVLSLLHVRSMMTLRGITMQAIANYLGKDRSSLSYVFQLKRSYEDTWRWIDEMEDAITALSDERGTLGRELGVYEPDALTAWAGLRGGTYE